MALKKSELYSSLWASCDALRGGMDASQYKDYVLALLFIKYVSDKYAGLPYAEITVPTGASFADMAKLKGKDDIGDRINKDIIAPLSKANNLSDFPDFNDAAKLGTGKEKVERLTELVAIFERKELDFSKNRADGDDILGDAYEYLMRHFATESGKSKGQFYTPAEVSRIMAKILGIRDAKTTAATTVYDPTCGSGSLLLKIADEARVAPTLYGQAEDPFRRFQAFGVPPEKQGDYAYLLHILRSMKETGRGACILPHGVLFRGGAEGEIRKNLVRKGYLRGIIGLPSNLFYGTGIPACILLLDKQDAAARKGLFLVDAAKGFIKDGPKNRLREQDLHRIVDAVTRGLEIPRFSRFVPVSEIEKNDFNLNLPRYIDASEPEDAQDIAGHLLGGIPEADLDALAPYWAVCPTLRKTLFQKLRPGYAALTVDKADLKSAILGHPEFRKFTTDANAHFAAWRTRTAADLKALEPGQFHPKELVVSISENLLAHYQDRPLLDAYEAYQHLMDYWERTMQDDAYLIATDGWKAAPYRVLETKKGKAGKEDKTVDKGWACDLVPKPLLVARYFAKEQAELDRLAGELETAEARLAELEEENSGDDGAFDGMEKINTAAVKAALKEFAGRALSPKAPGRRDSDKGREMKNDTARAALSEKAPYPHDADSAVLTEWLTLDTRIGELKRAVREADAALDAAAYAWYPKLSQDEIKALVADDKWLGALDADIHGEMDRIGQRLTRRLRELAERYESPLPDLTGRVAELESRVAAHLRKMGFLCQ